MQKQHAEQMAQIQKQMDEQKVPFHNPNQESLVYLEDFHNSAVLSEQRLDYPGLVGGAIQKFLRKFQRTLGLVHSSSKFLRECKRL